MKKSDEEFIAFIKEACRENEDAASFLIAVTEIAHFYDDLYDGDSPITKTDVQNALWATLVVLPRNEFYRKYFQELQPLISNAITNWQVANAMEARPLGEVDLRVAFVVRSSYADLIQQTALICGGTEWATRVGVAARRKCHSESWKDYVKSVEVQHGMVQRTESAGQQSGPDRIGTDESGDRPRAVGDGEGAV